MVLKLYILSGRRLSTGMLNLLFAVTMLSFALFCSALIMVAIFCALNALLERFADIGLADIWDYIISSVLNGLKSFF